MVRIETIKKTLEKHKQELKATYKVKDIGIFGSYVRREAKKKSDIDILVEFEDAIDLFDFLELEEHLSKILNIRVDLVMKRALKPAIGESIMREVIYV